MKVLLCSTASAAALLAFAAPALAAPDFTGVAQVYVGGGTADGSFFAGKALDDPFHYGGKAQGYWPLSPDIHLQVDVFGQHTEDLVKRAASSETDSSRVGGAVHLVHPFENRARFGLAGSVWNSDVTVLEFGPNLLGVGDATYGLVALEGQFFGENWTAFGQTGVFDTFSCHGVNSGPDCFGTIEGGTYLRGRMRYFLNDNTQLSLEGMRMWGSVDDDLFGGKSIRASSTHWTLEAEHKFKDSAFSGFLALAHQSDEVESIFSGTSDTQTVTIGVRFYLDQPTLRENDRSGAAMDTPTFGNALETSSGQAFATSVGGP